MGHAMTDSMSRAGMPTIVWDRFLPRPFRWPVRHRVAVSGREAAGAAEIAITMVPQCRRRRVGRRR